MSELVDILVSDAVTVAVASEVKNNILHFLRHQWAFFVSTLPLKGNAAIHRDDAWW